MQTLYWCPACARTHGPEEIRAAHAGLAAPRCALTATPLELLPAGDWQAPASWALVPLTPRPKTWYCSSCGSLCDDPANDYRCLACGALRPFLGGSATMLQCGRCAQWSLALARYCEWCGLALSAGGPHAAQPSQHVFSGSAEITSAELMPPGHPATSSLLYGLPCYPGALLLDERHSVVTDEASLIWHAFTSADEPAVVVAYYQASVGHEGFTPDGSGGIWRWPADGSGRVLHIMAVDDLGPLQQLIGRPPVEARTVIVVSQRFVEA